MESTDPIIATNTRYPRPLHDALQKLAREHRRSFNAEVMWALERYIHQEEAAREAASILERQQRDKATQ